MRLAAEAPPAGASATSGDRDRAAVGATSGLGGGGRGNPSLPDGKESLLGVWPKHERDGGGSARAAARDDLEAGAGGTAPYGPCRIAPRRTIAIAPPRDVPVLPRHRVGARRATTRRRRAVPMPSEHRSSPRRPIARLEYRARRARRTLPQARRPPPVLARRPCSRRRRRRLSRRRPCGRNRANRRSAGPLPLARPATADGALGLAPARSARGR